MKIVVFGGNDHEEAEARNVAQKAGIPTATATIDGIPVHNGNAHLANGFKMDQETSETPTSVIIFECSEKAAGDLLVTLRADHHNPGDTGFGMIPEFFWKGSSLGQLGNHLGVEPTQNQLMIAAGDHCPAAAYQGLCPGIDPAEFAQFRLQQKVELPFYQKDENKNTVEKLTALMETAREHLQNAPEINGIKDLRTSGVIEELPEAALSIGAAYMASIPDTDRDRQPTGNTKIVMGGNATAESVIKFMERANTLPNKVGNAYGNPTRGFAGVVVTPE